jgi:hypothetical protein
VCQLRARTKAHSTDVLTALECCLTLTEICQKEESLERIGILESILLLRGIMLHSCPQNRHPDEHDETLPKTPGFVSWRGLEGGIESEPEGILTLTPYCGWATEENKTRRRRLERTEDDEKEEEGEEEEGEEVTSEDVKLFFRKMIMTEFNRLSETDDNSVPHILPSSSDDTGDESSGSMSHEEGHREEEHHEEERRRPQGAKRVWWWDDCRSEGKEFAYRGKWKEWPAGVLGAILMAFIAVLFIAFVSKRK